jgi:hypothetical protein
LWVEFDRFGRDRVGMAAARCGETIDEFVSRAARQCLAGLSPGRIARRVPDFRRLPILEAAGRAAAPRKMRVTLRLATDEWRALEAESERQRVTVECLIQHAALGLLADQDGAAATSG